MPLRLLYPADSFKPKTVDETYAEEHAAACSAGWPVSLFNFEEFQAGSFRPFPKLEAGETLLYRGWMLTGTEYRRLHDVLHQQHVIMVTSPENYLLCHHLPGWYDLLKHWTTETFFFPEDADVAGALAERGWTGCFLKDYVKSLSTDGGSVVRDLSTIPAVIEKMKKYRGQIEGGLCARRLENYLPGSERRFFVCRGRAHGDHEEPPTPVLEAAAIVPSAFFTVDVAETEDGRTRIVELGDGQVSDRKHWSAEALVKMLGTPC